MSGLYCRFCRFLILFLAIIWASMSVYVTSPDTIWALRPRGNPPPCSPELRAKLVKFDLWMPTRFIHTSTGWRLTPRRGRRAGRRVQQQRPTPVSVSLSPSHRVTFACLNVRSLKSKLDSVMEITRDRRIDVFCVTESWHDSDSVCLGRLRSAGFNVVDRPRPRTADDLSVNHGGVVIFSAPDVVLKPQTVDQPSTFELVCLRAVVGQLTAIIAAIYRPGSVPVQQLFFDELGAVLEQLATYQAPVYITGDFNIHLERPDDPHSVQFRLLVDCYGMTLHRTTATHQNGGTLDAVITREDAGCPERVDVVDVGLSDHHLLSWSVDATRPDIPAIVDRRRSWRRLDIDQFRSMLSSSSLCQSDRWPSDIDDMAANEAMYDNVLNDVPD